MLYLLFVASLVWLIIFVASCTFDVWFELYRPGILTHTAVGRAFAAFGIAPLIITIGVTALVSVPFVVLVDTFFRDPWDDDTAWLETIATLEAAFTWFTDWVPNYVITGRE